MCKWITSAHFKVSAQQGLSGLREMSGGMNDWGWRWGVLLDDNNPGAKHTTLVERGICYPSLLITVQVAVKDCLKKVEFDVK